MKRRDRRRVQKPKDDDRKRLHFGTEEIRREMFGLCLADRQRVLKAAAGQATWVFSLYIYSGFQLGLHGEDSTVWLQ
jgi:hypothetical protein